MKFIEALLFSIVMIGGALYYAFNVTIPDVSVLKTQYPVVHYDPQTKKAPIELQKNRPGSWVSIKDVAKPALGAIIVSEDWAFFQHDGYDLNQIQIAIHDSWEKKHLGRGASTITQQVVKNVFLSNERSITRKVLELYLSVKLENALSKWKILEVYVNIAEMGPGIYGIGPAARYYYSKSPSELNAREGAFLSMLLPSPIRYGQSFKEKRLTPFARKSVRSILDKMAQAQYINEAERDKYKVARLSFETAPDLPNSASDEEGAPSSEEMAGEDNSAAETPANDNPIPAVVSPGANLHAEEQNTATETKSGEANEEKRPDNDPEKANDPLPAAENRPADDEENTKHAFD